MSRLRVLSEIVKPLRPAGWRNNANELRPRPLHFAALGSNIRFVSRLAQVMPGP